MNNVAKVTWISKIRPKTIKLLEENRGKSSLTLVLGKFGYDLQSTGKDNKYRQIVSF